MLAACGGEDFTPREEIDRLRLFGIRSATIDDPSVAWPRTGEPARLQALLTREIPTGQATARWSFCPVAFGSDGDFRCALDEAEFAAFVNEAVRAAVRDLTGVDLPADLLLEPDFDLGTSTVAFTRGATVAATRFDLRDVFFAAGTGGLPPELAELGLEAVLDLGLDLLCTQLQAQDFPDFVERPECDGVFPFRVDVEVRATAPEAPTETLRAQRFFDVRYDPDVPANRNPSLQATSGPSGICFVEVAPVPPDASPDNPSFARATAARAEAEDLRTDDAAAAVARDLCVQADLESIEASTFVPVFNLQAGNQRVAFIPLDGTTPPVLPLRLAQRYQLELFGLDRNDAEPYFRSGPDGDPVEDTEQLTVSWFVDAGGLERTRTAFEAGTEGATIDRLQSNRWTTPRPIDFDDPVQQLELVFVVRDDRGGRALGSVQGSVAPIAGMGADAP